MNCLLHPDRPAVAACSRCGKFLCKECAEQHSPQVFCDACYQEFAAERNEKATRELKSRKHCFYGFIFLAVLFGILFLPLCLYELLDLDPLMFLLSLVSWFWLAGFPYGWRSFNRYFTRHHWDSPILNFMIKYCLSMMAGGGCMAYHFYKYRIRKYEIEIIEQEGGAHEKEPPDWAGDEKPGCRKSQEDPAVFPGF